ncbi:MAG: enolase C-terminal domain-like protein [Candidatus Kaistia colombiensis]|nr:MAG: enolase C-terminal domain-like protein [Kaistia sp.]
MPRISKVEVHEFTFPVADIGLDAGGFDLVQKPGNRHQLSKFAVVIEAEGGLRGEYVGLWGATKPSLAQTLLLAPHLVGRDCYEREQIYDEFKRALRQYDHMGHGYIDIALWDLFGKAVGLPVATLLGGWRKRLPAYASTMHGDRNGGLSSPQDYVDFAEHCYGLGYRAFKMHGWYEGNVEEEVETVRRLGEAFRGRMALMLDPACQIRTFADAVLIGRACDEAGFRWFEDPFRDTGTSAFAHRKLRDMIRTPILQTEHVRGVEPKADFVIAGGTDLLRSDPEYDMGITGAVKIGHLAEALGLDVEIHACGPAHRHLMAATRNTSFYEVALVGPKARNPLPPVYACDYSDDLEAVGTDGCFPVPTGPGLGVRYDWDFIAARRTALHEFG